MEAIDEHAMDIDDDGSAANIGLDHAVDHPIDQHQKRKLSEMPIEILEQILINLDDEHLLAASLVCKLFAAVAETAFGQKYSNEPYKIHDSSERMKTFHKIMVSKYGGKVRRLQCTDQDEQLLDLIEQNCCNLKRIYLGQNPKLIKLKGLKGITLEGAGNLNRETFTELIDNNRDLECLGIWKNTVDLIDLLDGRADALETLDYHCETKLANNFTQIRLNSLETLKLKLSTDFVAVHDTSRLLHAIKCDHLEKLVLKNFYWNTNEVIDEICRFETLETLRLPRCLLTTNELRLLAWNLPHITKLTMRIDPDESNLEQSIFSVLSIFPKLTKLKITMEEDEFNRVLPDLQKSIYDFYGRLGKTNTVICIASDYDWVLIAKDRIILYLNGSLEIHWMDDLNESTMRKVMSREWNSIDEFKFINVCAQPALDVSTLIDPGTDFEEIHCLDFQSKGAISGNANTSRFFQSFPNLNSLKIQLNERNAIELLESLNEKFCKQINELWLNAKNVGDDTELRQRSDMANIIAKFENLGALPNNKVQMDSTSWLSLSEDTASE